MCVDLVSQSAPFASHIQFTYTSSVKYIQSAPFASHIHFTYIQCSVIISDFLLISQKQVFLCSDQLEWRSLQFAEW